MVARMVHWGLPAIVLVSFLTGCVTLRPDLKPYSPPLIVTKKVPLKIALMVPPNARNLTTLIKLPTACWDSGVEVEPAGFGTLFEQTAKELLSRVYEQVDLVQSVSDDSTYNAVLEASISKVGYKFGCLANPENFAEVDGTLRALDLQGKEVWRSGIATKRQDAPLAMSLGGLDQKFGTDIATVMALLVSDWIQELGRFPTKQWAKGGAAGELEEERTARVRDGKEEEVVIESDVDRPTANRKAAKKNAYAIVVGIEKYRERLPKADFAVRDAKIMADYLTKVLGYPEENVVVRTNDRATRNDLEKYFGQWLKNNVEPGGSVFIYYSGHGAPNPNPLKRLYESLEKLPAKEIVVVLDSCFSGAGGRSVLAKGARPMGISVENPVITTGKMMVLTASSGDQMSGAYEEKGHGLLTYFFLKGLQGYADTDEDGAVNMAELYDYIKPRVERIARKQYNNEQTPQFLASPEQLKRGGAMLIEKGGKGPQ